MKLLIAKQQGYYAAIRYGNYCQEIVFLFVMFPTEPWWVHLNSTSEGRQKDQLELVKPRLVKI